MHIIKREEPPTLSTDTQIVIGVVLPTLLLVGGLLLFIWRTERGRRTRREDLIIAKRPARPRINSYLHHLHQGTHKIVCEPQSGNAETSETVRPPAGLKRTHELEDTGKHELRDMNKRHGVDFPGPSQVYPPRTDSAVHTTRSQHEGINQPPLEEHDHPEADRSSRPSEHRFSNSLRSYLPRSSSYDYRHPPRADLAKREARVASSRYSREMRTSQDYEQHYVPDAETDVSTDANTTVRFIRSPPPPPSAPSTLEIPPSSNSVSPVTAFPAPPTTAHLSLRGASGASGLDALPSEHDNDEVTSPAVSDISRPPTTHRNSAAIVSPASDALDGRTSLMPTDRCGSQRRSEGGLDVAQTPMWVKRISAHDVVESKWREEGALV